MDNFDLRKYLSEGTLLKEENFSDEFVNFGKELAGEIEDELEKKELNEALGVVGILGYILLSNTIVLMMSKFAKKQFAKSDCGS